MPVNIDRITSFPNSHGDPISLYTEIVLPQSRLNELYISLPLSGGPAQRHVAARGEYTSEADLHQKTVEANVKGIESIIPSLLLHFPDMFITLPYLLGNKKNWRQIDYNAFWTLWISGIPSGAAQEVVEEVPTLFTNLRSGQEIPKAKRRDTYRRIGEEFATVVGRKGIPINPVGQMVHLPGHRESDGATHEAGLANLLGIPKREVFFNRRHPVFQRDVVPHAPWLGRGEHTVRKEKGNRVFIFRAF